ncbi:GM16872 [Drosophila sechellia]|uniref:GM16872 n=1 Tax=Drosophila sechellia TaxID=7238 RepID=B4IN10_DROSE|nr:GM16872 [Drosophila sechellia]
MNAEMVQALITNVVNAALTAQEQRWRTEIESVRNQVSSLTVQAPQVEVYERVTPDPSIKCDVKLDIVKSLPTFSGSHDEYVSWRQDASDAYEVFKRYKGSEAHYEAVVIIKNKICGNARALLTSHNTVLNFDAILARLDCTYADKTSLRVLRQNLEMVQQRDADLMAYYDEVERKLTLVTNKIVMSHSADTATILNKEVRDDALHAFIAGLKRPLKALVLPAQPKDLTTALALAREAENSIERSAFAASYAKAIEDKALVHDGYRRINKFQGKQWKGEDKNPHFIPKQFQSKAQEDGPWQKRGDPEIVDHNRVQPMEIDPSTAKSRQETNWGKPQSNSNNKRRNSSQRYSGQRRQRVNNITQSHEQEESGYSVTAEAEVASIEEGNDSDELKDLLHFLGNAPDCRSSNDSWLVEH